MSRPTSPQLVSIARCETPPNAILSNEPPHCFKEKKDPNALKKLVAQNKDELLTTVSLQKQNFLHFLASKPAFDMSTSEGFAVQKLVARMLLQPDGLELLLAIDNNDNTPLHTAVQYSNHNFLSAVSGPPSQAQTVEQVRRTIERGKGQWARCRSRSTFLHEALASRTLLYNEKLVLALIALAPSAMLRAKDVHGQTPLHLAVEYSMCTAQRIAVVKALIARKPSVLEMTDNKKRSVYQYHVLSKPESQNDAASSTISGDLDIAETAKEIKDELILASMRTMSCQVAQRCLHAPKEKEKELWFDYMPARSTDMTYEEFKKRWSDYDFEATLKYVSIANIKFKRDKSVSQVTKQSRDDATHIIRWLLTHKKVKRILNVTVDDMGSNYHSNESIEKALKGAKVEILDWKRPDLCPATIFKIGSNLRELHLHWGGNNAILRAWSEAEGLPMLAQYGNLERMFIIRPKNSPDLSSRRSEQEKQFNDRLWSNWKLAVSERPATPSKSLPDSTLVASTQSEGGKSSQDESLTLVNQSQVLEPHQRAKTSVKPPKIYHIDEEASVESTIGGNGHTGEKDQHRWIQCMEDFTKAFLQIKQPSDSSSVQVALIDDGVDTTNRLLQGKTYYGRSFAFNDSGKRNYPYWMSDSDHGTIMASFIRKLCPTANIYIIKVATRQGRQNSNRLTIDVPSAVEAINHAVDRGAKIISMSWSVKRPADEGLRQRFNNAVQRAVDHNTIMLCASSDQGERGNDETYPHDANRANIIRIGAATATGNNAEYVNKNNIDFLFPGHEIFLKGSKPETELGDVHKGSSVATAIASGLAALILECIRISYVWMSKPENCGSMEMIIDKHFEGMDSKAMKAVFKGISMSESRYIWVWETFTASICEKIIDGGSDDKYAAVANLANLLLKNGL
ncbi:hypothetical protein BKA60DRAFT_584621 [Fusarium oxysporum]|nr:hypothetical protein BKA60DRAFT_584621 [Fusarium oxysporum]